MNNKNLSEKIFNVIHNTPEYYLQKYKKRELKDGAMVTRYAPSPTGFQHIGGVFAALIAERLAAQSEGVFFLRVEDTDQKREVVGAIEDTIKTMEHFGMNFGEGMTGEETEIGNYGPYRQSHRAEIYNTFAKSLIEKGLAYPCFCTPEELTEVREKQVENKITPGYYGEYAKCRNLTPDQAITKIEAGEKYILRLKSPGNFENRVNFHDLVKGDISFPENNHDIVIVKSDGLPTYHFAHAIDDALMRTTHVTRGEEWLSSLPIHVQLFEVLGFELPKYAHFPSIMKLDGGSKRKLSKRKDAESAVSYYKEEGYPVASVVEYLLNLINSSFEVWREENPNADYHEFEISLDKMSKSGSLFDIIKLNDVSKNVICKFPAERVYTEFKAWAEEFDKEMYALVCKYPEITKAIFNIDKEGTKPRKDFGKWSDVREKVFFFYDELFNKETAENIELPKNMDLVETKRIAEAYINVFDINDDNEVWFSKVKELAISLGYTADRKAFKKNPEEFKGMVSDVAGAIRSVVAHRTNTPDLHTILQIMGTEMVKSRFQSFLKL